ncbi:MAG: asparaginase domain-containing protein [Campylobacterota bacterium]
MHIDIINTGGTFNKKYDPVTGSFLLDASNESILTILENTYDNISFSISNVINKDSNDMTDHDRMELTETIQTCSHPVIVVHGTDTMKASCAFVHQHLEVLDKTIIFTGSMYPYYVKQDESVFNLATSIAAVKFLKQPGIYIAMHGITDYYANVEKDYQNGKFQRI